MDQPNLLRDRPDVRRACIQPRNEQCMGFSLNDTKTGFRHDAGMFSIERWNAGREIAAWVNAAALNSD